MSKKPKNAEKQTEANNASEILKRMSASLARAAEIMNKRMPSAEQVARNLEAAGKAIRGEKAN